MMSGALIGLVALVLVALFAVIWLEEWRHERDRMRERLGRVVKTPQMVKHPECPAEVPEFCPICTRSMSWPVGVARVVTLTGSEPIFVCSYCLALGPMESAISAGVDHNEYPQRHPDEARPDGAFSANVAIRA